MLVLLSAFVFGVVLGLHYNVYVLIPASIPATATALGVGISAHHSYFAIVLLTILTLTLLQIGFLVGIAHSSRRTGKDIVPQQVPIERDGVVPFRQYRLAKTQSF